MCCRRSDRVQALESVRPALLDRIIMVSFLSDQEKGTPDIIDGREYMKDLHASSLTSQGQRPKNRSSH